MKAPDTRLSISIALVRIAFGIIWLIDAAFKWNPAFLNNYLGYLTDAAKDQPQFLHPWFSFWTALISTNPLLFAYLTALIETLTALGLLLGFAKKFGYIFACVFSLLIWSTAEGFGGAYTAGSTDIGTGIIYFLVFLLLLLTNGYAEDRLSLDTYLVKRISWWSNLSR